MLQTEFIRSLNSNYQRVLLDKKPEEKKYQYCMLSRGGIKGLLPCSLRYINGLAYLYYDITSKQNVAQLYEGRTIKRQWVKDLVWGVKQIQLELSRFLLDVQNVLWYPQQIFQELESNVFFFLYVPYYQEESSFLKLLEFMVEHIDYEDEQLVECIYHMYEQYERNGSLYLQEQIFEDAKMLEVVDVDQSNIVTKSENTMTTASDEFSTENMEEHTQVDKAITRKSRKEDAVDRNRQQKKENNVDLLYPKPEKRGFFSRLEGRKKKEKESRGEYEEAMQRSMTGYAVAEEACYEEEEWGKTIYMEDTTSAVRTFGLYTAKGSLVETLDKPMLTIGKKKEEADLVFEDASISRLHARIIKEQENYFLEDLNSTNGTFKNGLRMQPYEKRKLEEGDEVKLGKKVLFFCKNGDVSKK